MDPRFKFNTLSEIVRTVEPFSAIFDLLEVFNLGVESSFRRGGMDHMAPATTQNGLQFMHAKYAGWRGRGVKALNLVECRFLSVELEPGSLERGRAFTFEKWVFVDEKGGEAPTRGAVDAYDLVLEGGAWKVERVEFFARES